ncbi:hypothetical protein HNR05_003423 [Leifsonia psychrotolerans]|uniref:Uncharacterized protein n=1 Tax=Glaciibacter psychrotolerans TaxID=670054 RepID=A0A7Z0EIS4_9MICO|nr:hypothetical protein [Leifsonia psychrotolerans]
MMKTAQLTIASGANNGAAFGIAFRAHPPVSSFSPRSV